MLDELLKKIVMGKKGVEIGGPSPTGSVIYQSVNHLDNVIFSKETVWSNHTDIYSYFPGKTGTVLIHDAVDIPTVSTGTYDFVFASHSLEHIANPLKALYEWMRILKEDGYIILILPEKTRCFDHKRAVSSFYTLLAQYNRNTTEDDLSTLPEILRTHDLSLDLAAGSFEQFTRRSLDNVKNRCLHHYVYSPELLTQICEHIGCEFVYTITNSLDMWFLMKKKRDVKNMILY
jgi:SAM-dependent methyltransferase